METRITKIISRINCPETNSSSSHSFVFSEEALKPEDLLLSTQTLVPKIRPDGTKYIELDGVKDSYEIDKRVNDSKSKAIYAIASAKMILKSRAANKKIEKIKEIIKSTLGVDEVIITRKNEFSIDHQSHDTLESIINGDDLGLKEFIFNPRVWLFLLWDSEDCQDNPIFDVCQGYFNFEVSVKLPIKVNKFLDDPEIQEIEFVKLFRDYPDLTHLYDFVQEVTTENGIHGYSEKKGTVIIEEYDYRVSHFFTSETTGDEDIFEFFKFLNKGEDLYLLYIRSTLWKEIFENFKELHEIPDPSNGSDRKILSEEFQTMYNNAKRWLTEDSSPGFFKNIIINLLAWKVLSEENLRALKIKDEDIKLFKISTYSRQANEII